MTAPISHLPLQNIRTVALDAVGTVMQPRPSVGEIYHRIGTKYGTGKSVAEVVESFKRAFADTESAPPPSDQPRRDPWWTSEDEEFRRWREIVTRVLDDLSDPLRCFQEIHDHFASPSAWSLFPDVAETVDGLKRRGYRVVLASNFDNRLHSVCRGSEPLARLDDCFISSELGVRKPSLDFYRHMLDRLQSPPESLLMVGDDWRNDVAPALELGIPALWLNRADLPSQLPFITSLADLLELLPQKLPAS